jgi:DNA polymerase III subunit gamma/tau
MALLRMLAFRPQELASAPPPAGGGADARPPTQASTVRGAPTRATTAGSSAVPSPAASPPVAPRAGPTMGAVATRSAPPPWEEAAVATASSPPTARKAVPTASTGSSDWESLLTSLGLQGPTRQFAAHCILLERAPGMVRLQLDPAGESFRRPQIEQRIAQALCDHFGEPIRLEILQAEQPGALLTPAKREAIVNDDRQRAAEQAIEADPAVRAMREVFGATVKPGSVKPLSSSQ